MTRDALLQMAFGFLAQRSPSLLYAGQAPVPIPRCRPGRSSPAPV